MLRRAYDRYGRAKLVGRPHAWGTGCINYFVDGMPWLDNINVETGVGGIEDFIMVSEVGGNRSLCWCVCTQLVRARPHRL